MSEDNTRGECEEVKDKPKSKLSSLTGNTSNSKQVFPACPKQQVVPQGFYIIKTNQFSKSKSKYENPLVINKIVTDVTSADYPINTHFNRQSQYMPNKKAGSNPYLMIME